MKMHFIGIGGAGMHSLAWYAHESGNEISGSDKGASEAEIEFWQAHGVTVHREHRPENIQGSELVVYSSAVGPDNVERRAAEEKQMACRRGEMLARIANTHKSIAVCGTHGKGTTAAAISEIFEKCGRRVSDILGAVPVGRTQASRFTPDAQVLVCEVDESDKTHVFHRPHILLINNVEEDHLNVYGDLDGITRTFAQHVRDCVTSGTRVVIHYAGVGAARLYALLRDCPNILWIVSSSDEARVSGSNIVYQISDKPEAGGRFPVFFGLPGEPVRTHALTPYLGGRANAQNLMSAIAVACLLGIPCDEAIRAAAQYKGLRDRCEIHDIHGRWVVTDYASHPTCVTNDIAWIRSTLPPDGRVFALYHPYRYSLMQCLWHALVPALATADEALILPFDPCGEPIIQGISSENLAVAIQADGGHACVFESFEASYRELKDRMNPGDAVIVFSGRQAFEGVQNALVQATV